MSVQAIRPVFFGHHHKVKTLYKKGLLPTVKKDFYGDDLTIENATVEHLQPVSKGGKTTDDNVVIATKATNNARGNKPLGDFLIVSAMCAYLAQFKDIKVRDFDGNKYIAGIIKKVGRLLECKK